MALTIAETVVRNWERKRRRAQAHREGTSVEQVVVREQGALRAHTLAGELGPHLREALLAQISQSLRGCFEEITEDAIGPENTTEAERVEGAEPAERSGETEIGDKLDAILGELKALRQILGGRQRHSEERGVESADTTELEQAIDRIAAAYA
jgi:hypothetical protein